MAYHYKPKRRLYNGYPYYSREIMAGSSPATMKRKEDPRYTHKRSWKDWFFWSVFDKKYGIV